MMSKGKKLQAVMCPECGQNMWWDNTDPKPCDECTRPHSCLDDPRVVELKRGIARVSMDLGNTRAATDLRDLLRGTGNHNDEVWPNEEGDK